MANMINLKSRLVPILPKIEDKSSLSLPAHLVNPVSWLQGSEMLWEHAPVAAMRKADDKSFGKMFLVIDCGKKKEEGGTE